MAGALFMGPNAFRKFNYIDSVIPPALASSSSSSSSSFLSRKSDVNQVHFSIHLARNKVAYKPGDDVEGFFTVTNNNAKVCLLDVYAKLCGVLTLKKPKKLAFGTDDHCQVCSVVTILQDGNWDPLQAMTTCHIPFRLRVPSDAPATFKSPFASLVYEVQGLIQPNYKNGIYRKATKGITVKSFCDLNSLHPSICYPLCLQKSEFSLMPSLLLSKRQKANKCRVMLRTARSGYVAGENLPFVLNLVNPLRRTVACIMVSLVKETVACMEDVYKANTETIVAKEGSLPGNSALACHTNITWSDFLFIPKGTVHSHIVLSSFDNEQVLEHRYNLQVYVEFAEQRVPLRGKALITLGTVPLRSEFSRHHHEHHRPDVVVTGSLLPSYSELSLRSWGLAASMESLPPTYEEALKMSQQAAARSVSLPSVKENATDNVTTDANSKDVTSSKSLEQRTF